MNILILGKINLHFGYGTLINSNRRKTIQINSLLLCKKRELHHKSNFVAFLPSDPRLQKMTKLLPYFSFQKHYIKADTGLISLTTG